MEMHIPATQGATICSPRRNMFSCSLGATSGKKYTSMKKMPPVMLRMQAGTNQNGFLMLCGNMGHPLLLHNLVEVSVDHIGYHVFARTVIEYVPLAGK